MIEDKVDLTMSDAIASTEEVYAHKDKVPSLEQFEALENTVKKVFDGWQQREEAETFLQSWSGSYKNWGYEILRNRRGCFAVYITFAALSKPYRNKDGNPTPFLMYKISPLEYRSVDLFLYTIPQVAGLKTYYPVCPSDRVIYLRGTPVDSSRDSYDCGFFRVHSEEGTVERLPRLNMIGTDDYYGRLGATREAVFYNNLVFDDDPYFASELDRFIKKYEKKMKRKGLLSISGWRGLGGNEWFDRKVSMDMMRDWGSPRDEQKVFEARRPEIVEVKNG